MFLWFKDLIFYFSFYFKNLVDFISFVYWVGLDLICLFVLKIGFLLRILVN